MFDRFFEKTSNIKFHQNPSSVVPCGHTDRRTDMIKLIVGFRNFANASKYVLCGGPIARSPSSHLEVTRFVLTRFLKNSIGVITLQGVVHNLL
jgi:hypothetical protein